MSAGKGDVSPDSAQRLTAVQLVSSGAPAARLRTAFTQVSEKSGASQVGLVAEQPLANASNLELMPLQADDHRHFLTGRIQRQREGIFAHRAMDGSGARGVQLQTEESHIHLNGERRSVSATCEETQR